MDWKLEKSEHDAIWSAILENGQQLAWTGFGVGPITLSSKERAKICQKLLGIKEDAIQGLASQALVPFIGEIKKSLILHGTSIDLRAFHGDLTKFKSGLQAKNYAGYVETRAPILGKKGDMAVGRMEGWKISVAKTGLRGLEIPDLNHYYLSDALLLLAIQHLNTPQASIQKIINYLQDYPDAVVRLYVLDQSYQLFLTWLKQQTGLEKIYIDANSPEIGAQWNTKSCLYPSVTVAETLQIKEEDNPYQILEAEKRANKLYKDLGLRLPTLPGYLIERQGYTQNEFYQQIWKAAQLLKSRFGLQKGCLKACNSGDGARITPHIDLTDSKYLRNLAQHAYSYGDNYVLECHFDYTQIKFGTQNIKLTPSAHIRSGRLARGITLQFTKGTSWVGNLYVDENMVEQVGISMDNYHEILESLSQFLEACTKKNSGLVIGGMDFAIGKLGGKFGNDVLLGLQDPNISFNGAEFLRVYMDRVSSLQSWRIGTFSAATWIFVPHENCTHDNLEQLLKQFYSSDTHAKVIAVVPKYWAMIGVAATSFPLLVSHLETIQSNIKINYAK